MAQAKVNGTYRVDFGVREPQGLKDFPHRADVFVHAALLGGLVFGGQDACRDIARKDLKKWDGLKDALEVGEDADPGAEGVQLFPHGFVLVES